MRKATVLSISVFALSSALFSPGGNAQQSSDAPAAKASAQQVELPVVVRDKKGAIVTSLQKGDLSLTQDGRPQTIQSLTTAGSEPLRVGLLVETSRSMSGAMEAERKAATNFVDLVLPADAGAAGKDEAFLLHFDREVELLEDFTSSRDKLHQEIEDMGPTSKQRDDSQGPETTGDDRGSERNRRGGPQLYDAIYLAADELMKNKDGRKVLVVFSNGADHGSKETLNDAVDAADRAGLAVYTIYFKGEPERSYGSDSYPGSRRGGIGYPGGGGGYPGGYPGGGGRRQPEPTSSSGLDGRKIMQQIAARTGGHAFEAKHTGDLDPIYKLINDELRAEYVLTFTPDKPDNEGGFHKVAVTAGNKDWTVSTREGYYAPEK